MKRNNTTGRPILLKLRNGRLTHKAYYLEDTYIENIDTSAMAEDELFILSIPAVREFLTSKRAIITYVLTGALTLGSCFGCGFLTGYTNTPDTLTKTILLEPHVIPAGGLWIYQNGTQNVTHASYVVPEDGDGFMQIDVYDPTNKIVKSGQEQFFYDNDMQIWKADVLPDLTAVKSPLGAYFVTDKYNATGAGNTGTTLIPKK